MSDLSFRLATEADWPSIWAIFSVVVSSGDTYTYPRDMSEHDARAAWFAGPDDVETTYVALCENDVVGTALLKPNLRVAATTSRTLVG